MALDPKKWTVKTQEAVAAAVDSARSNNNPELTPDHLMVGLMRQEGTIVPAVLEKLGLAPMMVARQGVDAAIAKLPKAYGGSEPRMNRELNNVFDNAESNRKDLKDDYLSVEHLLLAMNQRLGIGSEELLQALQRRARFASGDESEPGGAVPGAREVRPGPDPAGPRRQDRSGHRP